MAIRGYFEPVRGGPLLTVRGGLAGNEVTVGVEVLEGRIEMDEEALVLSWIRAGREGVLKAVGVSRGSGW